MLSDFITGIRERGIPSRIRLDKGGEFAHIKDLMVAVNGDQHNSWIAGKSVHNIRIERLWRDVFAKVMNKYYLLFTTMEKNHLLDIENPIHMSILHHVYGRRIQRDLTFWQNAHNNHPIRTEEHKTPRQLWNTASLMCRNTNYTAMYNLFRRDASEYNDIISRFDDEFLLEEPDNIEHVLPRFPLPVTNAQLIHLNNSFDVMADSDIEGFDIYYNILRHIQSLQAL